MRARPHVLVSALMAIVCGWLGPVSHGTAQESVVGTVVAGERGYELPVEVVNRGAEAIQDVTVSVGQLPDGLVNVSVTPRRAATLPAGQTARFVVRFDVSRDAAPRDAAVLAFVVSARNAEFDVPDPRVAVAVIARPPAAGAPSSQAAPTAGRLVYVLTGVEAQAWVDHKPNQLGYAIRWTTASGFTSVEAVWCVDCPNEIVLGEPLHIEVKTRKRFDHPSYPCWSERGGKRAVIGEAPASIGLTFLEPVVVATGGPLVYPSCETLGIEEEHVQIRAEGQLGINTVRKATAAVTLEGTVSLVADYRPGRREDRDATHRRFHYSGSFGSSGTLSKSRSGVHHDVSYRTRLRRLEDVQPTSIAIEVGAMTLRYTLVVGGTPTPMTVVAFTLPAEFNRPPLGGPRAVGGAGTDPGDPRAGLERPGGASAQVGPPSQSDKGTRPGAPPGPGTGQAGPLRQADVAPLVREWLAVAEPPINARGGRTRYDEWGRVVGRVPGGVITAAARPDDAGPRTSTEYVWTLRDRLDSLDHCTLGTYVTRRLAGQSTGDCARAGGSRSGEAFVASELVGRRLREAVGLVAAAGLEARPQVGPRAPTPGLEGTIASATRQGKDVVLEVYTAAAIPAGQVPSVVGKRLAEAKAALEAVGLTIDPVLEEAAPLAGEAGRVHRQQPAPRVELPRGAAVRVWVSPGRGTVPTGTPRESASVGPGPGSDAERRGGPAALRFPAAIGGAGIRTSHPGNRPGQVDPGGLVARPPRGWLYGSAGAAHGQVVNYGGVLHQVALMVWWHPDPGTPCTHPAFDTRTRMVQDLSVGGRPQSRPHSSYVMSFHPQGRAVHAFLSASGRPPEELRRLVPEREASTVLGALLEQVAPYAQSCRGTVPTGTPRESRSVGPGPGSDAERRLGPESLQFPAVIGGDRLNSPHPKSFPGWVNLDSRGFVARPARGWMFNAAGGNFIQIASYGSAFYGSILSYMVVSVSWSPGPGQRCTRPRFETGSRMMNGPGGPIPKSSYVMSLHPQGKAAHASLGQDGPSLEQLGRKVPEDTAARILAALLEQVAPYAHSCR